MLVASRIRAVSFSISVEFLHIFTGLCLVICGVLAYLSEGVGMMLSWTIFGAMYISMSDIGEDEMSPSKRASRRHQMRVAFAYIGAFLSLFLLVHSTLALI